MKFLHSCLIFNQDEMSDGEMSNGRKHTVEVFTISYSPPAESSVIVDEPNESTTPCDFEDAVKATGYGLYNYLLLLAVLPGGWASFFDVTTMSYVLPSAECDLQLTLFHKGVLNAVTYAGMMTSAFFWGFLADTMGRRSLLMVGYLADSVCNILSSTSQSFQVLLIFKFLSGIIISGPFSINMTYLAEFHGVKCRTKALMWLSMFPSMASVALPGLAWIVIPQSWSFSLFDGTIVYNSWRIFILICSVPAMLAFLTLLYFPESPKFLMSQGKNDEAMKVFRRMYAINTGKPPESFPVKELCQERQKSQTESSDEPRRASVWEKARSGWAQIRPLFLKPHLARFLLIVAIQLGCMLSMNTLRLWMPQLFTMMENFDYENRDASLGAPVLCDIILASNPSTVTRDDAYLNSTVSSTCVVAPVQSRVYINSMIIACTSIIGYMLAGNLVNLVGKKNLLFMAYAVPAMCSFGLNWSPNSDVTLAIVSIFMALASLSINIIISFIIDLMPTSLRTMAVSLTMCVGRCGAMIGNLLFPILLNVSCIVPFMFIGCFLLVSLVLTIFIPKPPPKLV
ncbi:synaptic vesicle glycoprotein 2A-like [Neodiprion fabricii]|uniref:synaptic vesicle glycoprotein 2A-like n=1 Tax=Neodiprion fabricii TaxID=2872261 RepID=UPI001ED93D43|nr:synaptic vesicle glycoprotein 2A-like [Neodiprion fabricii]